MPKSAVAAPVWGLVQVVGRGDPEIARVANLQKGFVVREQLLDAGLGRGAIWHRLTNGRLFQVHRGVYHVGRETLEPLGDEMAAVLCFRGHAILSHGSAAAVWGLTETRPAEVTLTIVGRDGRERPGMRVCRVPELARGDLRARSDLPLTAPARTMLDLAGEASEADLEDALAAARARKLASDDEIRDAIARAPGRKGAARLARLLAADSGPEYTRSRGERLLRCLLRSADLPVPLVNVPLLGFEIDFLWPDQRLVVEVDGRGFHSTPAAFERDRRRDQVLLAAGYRVMRITWRQLRDEPLAVIARIAQALAGAGGL